MGRVDARTRPRRRRSLKGLTLTVNHNNTIAAGYEKDTVVSALLALHDASIPMDGEAVQGGPSRMDGQARIPDISPNM